MELITATRVLGVKTLPGRDGSRGGRKREGCEMKRVDDDDITSDEIQHLDSLILQISRSAPSL